jgi:hypothetical protein
MHARQDEVGDRFTADGINSLEVVSGNSGRQDNAVSIDADVDFPIDRTSS